MIAAGITQQRGFTKHLPGENSPVNKAANSFSNVCNLFYKQNQLKALLFEKYS